MKQSKRKPKPASAKHAAVLPVAVELDLTDVESSRLLSEQEDLSVGVVPPTPSVATESSFALGSSCTMREAAAIKVELMKLLSTRQTVLLDVNSVERIDTSALQLLCAFVRDRRARRLSTRWAGRAQPFAEAVEILGLSSALGYQPERAQ